MQFYEYKCPVHPESRVLTHLRGDRHISWCDLCEDHVEHRRVFSVAVHRPMQEHWNQTVQAPVSDMRDFREKLKVQGEAYSQRTGIDCNYQPVDLSDRKTLGVSEDAGAA